MRWDEDQAKLIVAGVLELGSLKASCESMSMRVMHARRWMLDEARFSDGRSFRDEVRRAEAEAADDALSEAIGIADSEEAGDNVQLAKLRVETRITMAKLRNRDRYGDRMTIAGDRDNPLAVASLTDAELTERVRWELEQARMKAIDQEVPDGAARIHR